eukprot:3261640-Pyramimonas_sp.AAC.2
MRIYERIENGLPSQEPRTSGIFRRAKDSPAIANETAYICKPTGDVISSMTNESKLRRGKWTKLKLAFDR